MCYNKSTDIIIKGNAEGYTRETGCTISMVSYILKIILEYCDKEWNFQEWVGVKNGCGWVVQHVHMRTSAGTEYINAKNTTKQVYI